MSPAPSRPLLVVDGDSLAHRAYHALPKSFRRAAGRPGNALLGFSNFIVRLWDSDGRALGAPMPQPSGVAAIAFHGDGLSLAVASGNSARIS